MKKIYTFLAAMIVAFSVSAQISILSTDMPAPTVAGQYPIRFMHFALTNPTTGANQSWNYDTATTIVGSVYGTFPETEAYFTAASIDAYRLVSKHFGTFSYNYYQELDFNTTSVTVAGHYISAYSKQPVPGGNPGDSLSSSADSGILVTTMPIINFPMNYTNSWHATSGRIGYTFLFSSPTLSLTNYPVQNVFRIHEDDTVTGWGKMRIYNAVGKSIWYDVLMDERYAHNTDSFYSGGVPLSAVALAGLHLTQGQNTDSSYETIFFRKTTYCPLADFSYGSDASRTSQKSIFFDSTVTLSLGINDIGTPAYTTVLYPNPSNGSEINMMISGVASLQSVEYYISDMTGKVLQSGKTNLVGNKVKISINSPLDNGNYIMYVANKENGFEAKEEFTVNK